MPPLKLFGCLRNLGLSSTANGQYLADDISDVIESNIMLQHLNLSNCRLSELRLMKITLSVVKLSMLKRLDISRNEIADEAAVAIASAIKNDPSLQHLLLNNCNIPCTRIRNQEIANAFEMYFIFAVS